MKNVILLFAGALMVLSCTKKICDCAPPSPGFGETFDVYYQQSVTVNEDEVQVSFPDLVEDSRCPTNAECVWAGRAVVKIQLDRDGQSATLTMGLGDLSSLTGVSDSASALGYKVKLVNVLPAPVAPVTTAEEDYWVKLMVTKE